MKRILSALVAVSVAFPAAAQDLRYSSQILADCLAGATSGAERRGCIGRAAQACMEATPDGSTTYGSGYCWERERADWDREMGVAYRRLLHVLRQEDSELAELGGAMPSVAEALSRAQEAWIAWRDAACAYEMAQWGGGSGAGPAYTACLAQMTAERLFELQGFPGAR